LLASLVDPQAAQYGVFSVPQAAFVLGAFQRAASALNLPRLADLPLPVRRRASGGPALRVGPGTLHVLVTLPTVATLTPGDAPRLVNRHVRPLLRALTRVGHKPAHFLGRDWVSIDRVPVAWVGFAHHAGSGHAAFEAFVAVTHSVALPSVDDGYPARSLLEHPKTPTTLQALTSQPLSVELVADAIRAAYEKEYGDHLQEQTWSWETRLPLAHDERPPWSTLVEEAIGYIGASAAPAREIGGDFFASSDLVSAINAWWSSQPENVDHATLENALFEMLRAKPYALEGIRNLQSLVRAIRCAGGSELEKHIRTIDCFCVCVGGCLTAGKVRAKCVSLHRKIAPGRSK